MADLIHWLHLTDDDLSQARRIIAAFKEDDTIDALGFLRISERFDDWCYPAVTTPMTRARYYLFVPAIYRALERQQLGLRELRDGAESMQHQLRRILIKTERPRNGVIGERADDKIRRLPSALYWSSLTTLSLLARCADGRSLSEAGYLRAATSRASDSDEVETDEGIDAEGEVRRFWNHDLPVADILTPRGQLRHGLQLRLTAGEAKYLRDKFRQVPGSKESVLGFRVQRRLAGPFDHAWSILSERDLPDVLRRRLRHARSFSAAARAVSLVYYALVLEEKQKLTKAKVNAKKAQGREDLIDEFRFWWDKARCYVVEGWDPTAFQREVTEAHCRETDRKFLDDIVKLSRAAVSPVGLFDSSELRTLVKHREAKVRRQKCRLCGRPEHRRYLQQWEAPPKRRQSAFQLSFRHNTGDTIVRDLLRKPHRRSADVQD